MQSTDDSTAKHSSGTSSQINKEEGSSIIDDEMVIEEDDLASVISDQISPNYTPDYSTKIRQTSGEQKRRQLQMDILHNMNEEEQEFLKFCAPQINQHVDTLTQVIEQFFSTIEGGQHPTKFSQKLRLISIESMTLVHLSSNVSLLRQTGWLITSYLDGTSNESTRLEGRIQTLRGYNWFSGAWMRTQIGDCQETGCFPLLSDIQVLMLRLASIR